MNTQKTTAIPLHGKVAPGFEAVRGEFARNFSERGEVGAAISIFHRGEPLVDLWGGYRDGQTRTLWEEDTLVLMYSATKGAAGLTMALAQARGLFDNDTPVATYWPAFAQQGKECITVRQLLAHQAGLCLIDTPLTPGLLADHNALAAVLARQKPLWEPGTRQGYHAFSLGLYESEIIRRTDPKHRPLSRFFHDELAQPLDLELYIGVPTNIPAERIASIQAYGALQLVLHLPAMPLRYALGLLYPRSITARTLLNPKVRSAADWNRPEMRTLDMPSATGVGQVRSLAKLYSVFATGGQELGIPPDTLAALMAPACPL